ncbi:Protocatechuate 3,4-dioxygenase alpha chain [Ralstonia condita]|uniref:Protocatechuate 3,4-dioxygenase alpha chain n=1 Tax=Ralstonia condita TaxID=3058600 RepID=A0ABN9IJ07_9RALS|nr:protocatechuate 3,4-dioxygenase subunit alpha [Ralstonia sp. LMG 7141]CAJ0781871.1 Protocatechuate 3,4-dioxygenase alpha chain [Ralstonia sp. LMG 7141]
MTMTTLRQSLERDEATSMATTPPFAHFNETASQTGGPYVHIGLAPRQAGFDIYEKEFGNVLTTPDTRGERIALEGRVFDGSGSLVRDVLIEIWQANADGKYAHPADRQDKPVDPAFRGWGRAGADFDTGVYRFETIKPGAVAGRGASVQAPHICMILFARGINLGLHTRVYFSDETGANGTDPVLGGIEWEVRRKTLIAQRSERNGEVVYTFDVRLQDTPDGGAETVFFDI